MSEHSLFGTFAPGSESARERKVHNSYHLLPPISTSHLNWFHVRIWNVKIWTDRIWTIK